MILMSDERFERWNDYSCKVKDNQEDTFLNWEDVVQKLNEQQDTIEQLHLAIDDLLSHTSCDEIKKENERLKKSEKINMEYAEQIVEENQKLRIAKNDLRIENEQLRKQIQNYEQLISNSYVGEEETLDGFVGKYVIWEDELQKYKNKNEMINNG